MRGMKKRRADIILVGVLLAAGIVAFALLFFMSGKGDTVVVKAAGRVVMTLPLDEDKRIRIDGVGGYNILVIEKGEVSIAEADCPDETCVKTGRISKGGQSIICLPHRVTVEISSDGDEEVDATVG